MSVFRSFKYHFIFFQDSPSPSSLEFNDLSGVWVQNWVESIHGSLFVRLTISFRTAFCKIRDDLAQPCILLIYQTSYFFTVSFLVFLSSSYFCLMYLNTLHFIIQLYLISFQCPEFDLHIFLVLTGILLMTATYSFYFYITFQLSCHFPFF